MQFDDFFCYKDIGSKAFFTMATLLMPLLGNVCLDVDKITTCYVLVVNNFFSHSWSEQFFK